jgi:hypothetical protein
MTVRRAEHRAKEPISDAYLRAFERAHIAVRHVAIEFLEVYPITVRKLSFQPQVVAHAISESSPYSEVVGAGLGHAKIIEQQAHGYAILCAHHGTSAQQENSNRKRNFSHPESPPA